MCDSGCCSGQSLCRKLKSSKTEAESEMWLTSLGRRGVRRHRNTRAPGRTGLPVSRTWKAQAPPAGVQASGFHAPDMFQGNYILPGKGV